MINNIRTVARLHQRIRQAQANAKDLLDANLSEVLQWATYTTHPCHDHLQLFIHAYTTYIIAYNEKSRDRLITTDLHPQPYAIQRMLQPRILHGEARLHAISETAYLTNACTSKPCRLLKSLENADKIKQPLYKDWDYPRTPTGNKWITKYLYA